VLFFVTGGDHLDPSVLQCRHHRPALDPAGVEHRAHAGEPPAVRRELGGHPGLLLGHEDLDPVGQLGVPEHLGKTA
jgi:hypothetical protein